MVDDEGGTMRCTMAGNQKIRRENKRYGGKSKDMAGNQATSTSKDMAGTLDLNKKIFGGFHPRPHITPHHSSSA
jgi:hypothetical protein